MSQATPRHSLPYIFAGQAQKELTHNEALILLDALAGASAVSAGFNVPPTNPAPGQCWILGSSPAAEWTGQEHALACWTENGWRFLSSRTGMRVWVEDQQLWAERTAAGWVVGDVLGQRLVFDGNQVAGPRLAAVAAPTGGAVQDVEARATLSLVIARLVAHGLIAA
jgi:hypothetical protein